MACHLKTEASAVCALLCVTSYCSDTAIQSGIETESLILAHGFSLGQLAVPFKISTLLGSIRPGVEL